MADAAQTDDVRGPPTPYQLPILEKGEKRTFAVPVKKIHEGHDVTRFLRTKAYGNIMNFLLQLNRAVFPSKVQESGNWVVESWRVNLSPHRSLPVIQGLQSLLEKLAACIDEVPPAEGPRRFGNVSFRNWYDKVIDAAPSLLNEHLPSFHIQPETSGCSIQEELLPYFLGSFGSAQRLDYGSGHELSFFAFLACIWKLGGFNVEPDLGKSQPTKPQMLVREKSQAIVLEVMSRYFHLIRRLIKTYNLEPAGSHGVWGLDDHSFLPYIFGSAQYGPAIDPSSNFPTPTEGSLPDAPDPASVTKATLVEQYRGTNLYFGAIGFIHDVKKGPFWEHSPMLYDISGVEAGWAKINKVRQRDQTSAINHSNPS